jgi:hypothetical protein
VTSPVIRDQYLWGSGLCLADADFRQATMQYQQADVGVGV